MADKYQQRDALTGPDLCPPWLCGNDSNAQKYMYCIGLGLDGLLEKMNEAMTAKLPGQADPSCIPLQAADRVFVQGPAESNASFIVRLQGAFQAWARAGSRPSALGQLQGYLTGLQPGVPDAYPECLIVGGNTDVSTWSTIFRSMTQGAPPARAIVTPPNWNWDNKDQPARAWLVLFMNLVPTGQSGAAGTVASTGSSGVVGVSSGFATITGLTGMVSSNELQYITLSGGVPGNTGTFQIDSVLDANRIIIANPTAVVGGTLTWSVGAYPYIGPAPVWGSIHKTWGDDQTWGLNCSPLVIQSIRAILKTWKSASTYYPNIIVSFGGGDGTAGNEFSPLSTQGAGNPDGTWGDFGKNVNGVWVPAKEPLNPATAFCDGTGLAVRCYEKNET